MMNSNTMQYKTLTGGPDGPCGPAGPAGPWREKCNSVDAKLDESHV